MDLSRVMNIPAGNNMWIEFTQTREAGANWTVKLYKKVFLFKKLITSDWFMNEEQAKAFAEKLAAELKGGSGLVKIVERKPGWTLHRPLH